MCAGVCASFAGAALLASIGYLILRSRQGQVADVRQPAPLRTATAAALMGRPSTPPLSGPPAPGVGALPTPPCSPNLSTLQPASPVLCSAALAALASMHPPQHRLASSSGVTPDPAAPHSARGFAAVAGEAGTGTVSEQHSLVFSHPLLGLRRSSTPGSPSSLRLLVGSSGSTTSSARMSPCGTTGLQVIPAARHVPAAPNTLTAVDTDGSMATTSAAADTAPSPAQVMPASPRYVPPASLESPPALEDATDGSSWSRSFAHTPLRNATQSLPGSPGGVGAWGSAVKVYEHGSPSRHQADFARPFGSLESLRVRMERLRREPTADGAAAAAVAAAGDEVLAVRDGLAEEATAAVVMPAAVVEEAPGGEGQGDGDGEPALESEAGEGDVIHGSPSAHGSRGAGSFAALVWPHSPRGTWADGSPVPSPRGVAALMAAPGTAAVGAGEVLMMSGSTAPGQATDTS